LHKGDSCKKEIKNGPTLGAPPTTPSPLQESTPPNEHERYAARMNIHNARAQLLLVSIPYFEGFRIGISLAVLSARDFSGEQK